MSKYRLFGADTSPYSYKVRAALKYKGVKFDWVGRSARTEAEFQAYASVPTVPLLVSPDAPASQDSTAILAQLEKDIADPSITPDDPACAALALLLEDYADEWLNKAMFQQRWGQAPDAAAAALRVLQQLFGGRVPASKADAQDEVAGRMAARLELVGANGENAGYIASSFHRFIGVLNTHLEQSLFIFGGRPSAADFAVAGQLQQMLTDPTPGEYLRDRAPFVTAWCEFMEDPKAGGPFVSLEELSPTLLPLFKREVARSYLPWAAANSASATRRRKKFSATLESVAFEQATQRYAAKSFKAVRKAVGKMSDAPGLDAFMDAADMKPYLD